MPIKRLFSILWVVSCILLVSEKLTAQTVSIEVFLPPLDTLHKSCINFYKKQAIAELEQFNYRSKGKILNYLPMPGWNYAGTPMLTVNTSIFFQAINFDRSMKAQARQIVRTNETLMNAALIEVTQFYQALTYQVLVYNSSIERLELEKQKFSITQKDFENSLILPSQYLAGQISLSSEKNQVNQKLYDLYRSRSELLIKAKKGDWVSLLISSDVPLNSNEK